MGQVPAKSFTPSAPAGASSAANTLNPSQPMGQNPQQPLLPPNFNDPGAMPGGSSAAQNPLAGLFGGGGQIPKLPNLQGFF